MSSSKLDRPRVGHIWKRFRPRVGHIKPRDLAGRIKQKKARIECVDRKMLEATGLINTGFFTVESNNDYNTTHSRIWLTCTLLGDVPGVNGTGTLATVNFQAATGGNTTLHLTDTVLGDSDANPIDHTVEDGKVQVIGISDIAITTVTPTKTIVGQSYTMKINVTIENQGDQTENFNLTVHANTTMIRTKTVNSLPPGNQTTLTFIWNTTSWTIGNYTLSAVAQTLPGETDTEDNCCSDGWAFVAIPGDVDGDRDVDIYDVVKITGVYWSETGDPEYKPNSNINGDTIIDIYDVVICTSHYNQNW